MEWRACVRTIFKLHFKLDFLDKNDLFQEKVANMRFLCDAFISLAKNLFLTNSKRGLWWHEYSIKYCYTFAFAFVTILLN